MGNQTIKLKLKIRIGLGYYSLWFMVLELL